MEFRPRGMVGRITLVLLLALSVELLGNVALDRWAQQEYVTAADVQRLAMKLADADRIATAAPAADRAGMMSALSSPGMKLNWVPHTVITDFSNAREHLGAMKRRLIDTAPGLARRPLRLSILPSEMPGRRDLVGALRLADRSFVTFRLSPYIASPPGIGITTAAHLALTGLVLLIALLMIRTLIQPLSDLADAADATRPGQPSTVRIQGPSEVRRVATAFVAMQDRLLHMMEEHTHALIAVSHDLRTPIQRLRLRTALLDDSAPRDAMTDDLIEMERMIESTLAYVRHDQEEAVRLIDVAAIVATAVDNAADTGAAISFHGCDALLVSTHPGKLRRILGNLIDNAVRHGTRIAVTLAIEGEHYVITVDDDGAGIPPERRAEALLPFRRLEDARGRTSGGAGLGLATSSKAASALGGTLFLRDSRLGGLSAGVRLPMGIQQAPSPRYHRDFQARQRHSKRGLL